MTDEILNSSFIDALLEKWRRRKWLVIASFLLLFSIIAGFVTGLPALYVSSTKLLFGQDGITESMVKVSAPNELELRLGLVTQAVLSREQLQQVIESFDLYSALRRSEPAESVIKRFRQDIGIVQQAATQPQWGQNSAYSVTISYRGWNPELVAAVANELAARFKAENERVRNGQAGRTTEFIKTQMDEARARLAVEEGRVNAFRSSHVGELPEQQAINLATLNELNSELRLKGEKEVQLLDRRNVLLFGSNGGGQTGPVAGLTGSLRLDRLERDLAEMLLHYTASYPGVIRLQNEISQLQRELKKGEPAVVTTTERPAIQNPAEINEELAIIRREAAAIKSSIAEMVSRIERMPLVDQQLKSFTYDHDTAREAYLSLQKHYQDARLTESLEQQQSREFKILEVAIPPDYPTAPNPSRLMLMAFVMAAGFAGGAGLFAESLDGSFHRSIDLRRFTTVPVLATIGNIRTRADKWRAIFRWLLGSVLLMVGIAVAASSAHYLGTRAGQLVSTLAG